MRIRRRERFDISVLKLCPFCGGRPDMLTIEGILLEMYRVACLGNEHGECTIYPHSGNLETQTEAMEAWNTRA